MTMVLAIAWGWSLAASEPAAAVGPNRHIHSLVLAVSSTGRSRLNSGRPCDSQRRRPVAWLDGDDGEGEDDWLPPLLTILPAPNSAAEAVLHAVAAPPRAPRHSDRTTVLRC